MEDISGRGCLFAIALACTLFGLFIYGLYWYGSGWDMGQASVAHGESTGLHIAAVGGFGLVTLIVARIASASRNRLSAK